MKKIVAAAVCAAGLGVAGQAAANSIINANVATSDFAVDVLSPGDAQYSYTLNFSQPVYMGAYDIVNLFLSFNSPILMNDPNLFTVRFNAIPGQDHYFPSAESISSFYNPDPDGIPTDMDIVYTSGLVLDFLPGDMAYQYGPMFSNASGPTEVSDFYTAIEIDRFFDIDHPCCYEGWDTSYEEYSIGFNSVTVSFDGVVTNAIPEPAAWALMLVGFGAAGAVIRRTRRGRQSSGAA